LGIYSQYMSRPKGPRRVNFIPEITYFKPIGIPLANLKEINLNVDELETVRLVDFEGNDQEEAAKKMKISQSTVQRILTAARNKIAKALVLGQAIRVKGGEDFMALVGGPGRGRGGGFGQGGRGRGRGRMGGPLQAGPGGYCSCPNPDCDYKEAHLPGKPCYQQVCPKCGSQLIRRRQG
jgi:predicted DNA-binding protein (UPF0251 family)